jgi:hypothetical protein
LAGVFVRTEAQDKMSLSEAKEETVVILKSEGTMREFL